MSKKSHKNGGDWLLQDMKNPTIKGILCRFLLLIIVISIICFNKDKVYSLSRFYFVVGSLSFVGCCGLWFEISTYIKQGKKGVVDEHRRKVADKFMEKEIEGRLQEERK